MYCYREPGFISIFNRTLQEDFKNLIPFSMATDALLFSISPRKMVLVKKF